MRTEEVPNNSGVFEVRLFDKLVFADHTAFRKLMDDIRSARVNAVIFDVANLNMIDSSGLGMLMIAIEESKRNNYTLTLKNAVGPVKQLLELSKLDQILKVA